jgi:tetratricopeptide (TPR) repeat protein
MNAAMQRAMILHDQHRYADAERELKQVLAAEPQNAHAHAMLGLCLMEQRQYKEATAEAEQAVGLEPHVAFGHYVHASVLAHRNHGKAARAAIKEALRLESFNPSYYAMLASIEFDERQWPAALEAAENGLAIQADHAGCVNLRAMALVKLGRKDEAGATIRGALERDPHNAMTHASQGWQMLHLGQHKQALIHFREALRIKPDLDWAREGMIEALKARNPIYRVMLKYFLFMARLSRGAQWGILIGGYVLYRILLAVEQQNPKVRPYIIPLLICYVVFAVMTWIASPLFNLMLRVSRYGRHMLTRDERVASNFVGGMLLGALVCGVGGFVTASATGLIAGLVLFALVIPTSAVFRLPTGAPRNFMGLYTAGLAVVGGLMVVSIKVPSLDGQASTLSSLYWFGILFSSLVANALFGIRFKR